MTVCLSYVAAESKIEQSLIIEVEEKPYCSSVSVVWWYVYRDYTRLYDRDNTKVQCNYISIVVPSKTMAN